MGTKYFCWNIDDGLEQDKKITEYFRKCGIGATFNLNSGTMGRKQMIAHVGDIGFKDIPLEEFDPDHFDLDQVDPRIAAYLKNMGSDLTIGFKEEFRIPADEAVQVYEGFEVASHSLRHENLMVQDPAAARESVLQDVANLSAMFGTTIRGFAYPFGMMGEHTIQDLKDAGVLFARTTERAADFRRPADYYRLPMTASHSQPDVFEKLEAFFAADASEEDLFFLMFAHGYEMDFGTETSNWDRFRKICDLVANRTDVRCVSTSEGLGLIL